jgi:hypothetical protein
MVPLGWLVAGHSCIAGALELLVAAGCMRSQAALAILVALVAYLAAFGACLVACASITTGTRLEPAREASVQPVDATRHTAPSSMEPVAESMSLVVAPVTHPFLPSFLVLTAPSY